MRLIDNSLFHSPTDLVRFLGCAHATALDLQKLRDPASLPEKAANDAMTNLLSEEGIRHEEAFRDELAASVELVEIPSSGVSLEKRAALTREAMADGAPAIFQAAFLDAPWSGFADFLRRIDQPSALGPWSYEPVDTKLARSVKPSYIVQLGLYADQIEAIQQAPVHHVHVALGSGNEETFRLAEFTRTLGVAKKRYLDFIESGAHASRPDPCAACDLCGWREHCAAQWLAEDHLDQVAGLDRTQAKKLRDAGIETVAALASASEDTRVPQLAPTTFAKLREQARLQVARREGGKPVAVPMPAEPGRGFALMPPPHPADLFFDLEGDPLTSGGLEYLWGVHYREDGKPVFRYRWGHDPEAERLAFENTLDWMAQHLAANPGAHVYHYAPYEITALRRLSTQHASREAALDDLLRQRRFVDLYSVLRQAIRTSEPNLSLKTMEIFFAAKRDQQVTSAGDSVIEYKSWQATGEQATLDAILEYNKVDCENTEALRDWLVSLREESNEWRAVGPATPEKEETTQGRLEAEQRAAELVERINAGAFPSSERGRELVGHLTQFHRRADKPAFWAMFDRCERDPEELIDDGECIGEIEPLLNEEGEWLEKVKRSTRAHYRFPLQETKLREGMTVLHAPTLTKCGKIEHLDTDMGAVIVKRQLKEGEMFPQAGSLIPEPTVPNEILVKAVRRVAEAWAATSPDETPAYRALLDIIERNPPRLHDWQGGPLRREGDTLVEAASLRALALDESALFIQGPPGTGKTFTSAHAILSLIAAGKRVGVSSNSHKAVNNLLAKVAEVAEETGTQFIGVKKATRTNGDSSMDHPAFIDDYTAADVSDWNPDLVGGTAWFFADEGYDQYFDYLFIDEAGQVSLGHLLAMGTAARNLVLVGDQMQLAQPIQGAHPGESGLSALDYMLQGEATVAPDRGILLDTSWRMHPSICGFISEAVYDGRLEAHPDCARQRLHLASGHDPVLAEHGLRFVAMDHELCGQRSAEEVARVKELAKGLIGTPFTDRAGIQGTIGWDNILIVAPFNMQVNALVAALPVEARVGTVDRFQGQEAEVVIVSMTTSSPDDLPRHVDFFYSKNRINVAISRARTLALVLANPKLLELDAKSVDDLRLVNTLAWVAEEGVK